jgi:glycosyltransferase involved in cell wall biosynthesis
MRVAINCAVATRGYSGTERALSHLLRALRDVPWVDEHQVWPGVGLRRNSLWNASVQASWDLYYAARTSGPAEVLISPCNIGRSRADQRHVLVMHDTMVLDMPDRFDRGYALYARALFGLSVRWADGILVPSAYTRSRLEARWPEAPPITVAPWPLQPRQSRCDSPYTRARKPILMVGATEPHKRQCTGIDAAKLARELSGEDLRLIIVGPRGRAENEVASSIKRADPKEAWISRRTNVPQAQLEALYDDAWLLLQPSLLEGYGLPVGEAAITGVPVLHSGRGALSEIAPKAVAPPDSPSAYAAEICLLLNEDHYALAVDASHQAARRHTHAHFTDRVTHVIRTIG